MDVDFVGAVKLFNEVEPGDVFAFRHGSGMALGIKTGDTGRHVRRDIMILKRGDDPNRPPHIFEQASPRIVYAVPAIFLLDADPSDLQEGVSKLTAGNLLVTSGAQFVCFEDIHPPESIGIGLMKLANGAFLATTSGPTAVFARWRIVVTRKNNVETLFQFPPVSDATSSKVPKPDYKPESLIDERR
jgi:hypothetical protein